MVAFARRCAHGKFGADSIDELVANWQALREAHRRALCSALKRTQEMNAEFADFAGSRSGNIGNFWQPERPDARFLGLPLDPVEPAVTVIANFPE
jgi:hypothetical protein